MDESFPRAGAHKYRLSPAGRCIEIGAAQGGEEDNKIENRLVVANEELAGRRSQPRNAKRSALNRKREARQPAEKASRLLVRFGRLIIGLPIPADANGAPVLAHEHTHARSRRYYVRSRIESKVVRESAGRPRRPHGVAAEHVLAPWTRLIAVIRMNFHVGAAKIVGSGPETRSDPVRPVPFFLSL
jgi:hypothetical protein